MFLILQGYQDYQIITIPNALFTITWMKFFNYSGNENCILAESTNDLAKAVNTLAKGFELNKPICNTSLKNNFSPLEQVSPSLKMIFERY